MNINAHQRRTATADLLILSTVVIGAVAALADIIGEISTSSHEQSSGITQVNQAVSQLDAMTQQNAALVEQSAAASASLRSHADRLLALVVGFRMQTGRT